METTPREEPRTSPRRSNSNSSNNSNSTPQPGDYMDAPRPQDVASTRDRKWQNSHEQNIFYRNLILQVAPTISKVAESEDIRRASEHIVDVIMIEKRGVFCRDVKKQQQHPNDGGQQQWLVMDRKSALVKVQQAIRNYRIKAQNGGWHKDKRKKKKGKKISGGGGTAGPRCGSPNAKQQANKTPATKVKGTRRGRQATAIMKNTFSMPVVRFHAQAGDGQCIHPYALSLISAVCNQARPVDSLRVLDAPLSQFFNDNDDEEERSKERTIRLQLRHRYVGALAQGIPPRSFSEKLLAHWGGSLSKETCHNMPIGGKDETRGVNDSEEHAAVCDDEENEDTEAKLQSRESASEEGSIEMPG